MPRIKKVTYSKPVTLIRWDDDTITKAFCDEVDNYDELTGFLMCIIKKMMPAKEMRKLFSKYVYGDDPKYIKRIVPKKERKKICLETSPWYIINPKYTCDTPNPSSTTTSATTRCVNDCGIEEFIKSLDELMELLNDED